MINLLFNGIDQSVSIPSWSPNGLNFSLSFAITFESSAIGTESILIFGADSRNRIIKNSSDNLSINYVDDADTVRAITIGSISCVAGTEYIITVSSDGEGVEFGVNGVAQTNTDVAGGFDVSSAMSDGTLFTNGSISDIILNDLSSINDGSFLDASTGDIQVNTSLSASNFIIEYDIVTDLSAMMRVFGNDSNFTSRCYIEPNGSLTYVDAADTYHSAVSAITANRHHKIRIVDDGTDVLVYVDNALVISSVSNGQAIDINVLHRQNFLYGIGIIGSFTFTNVSTNETTIFELDNIVDNGDGTATVANTGSSSVTASIPSFSSANLTVVTNNNREYRLDTASSTVQNAQNPGVNDALINAYDDSMSSAYIDIAISTESTNSIVFETSSASNNLSRFVANGSSYITSPTLGDIRTSKLRVVVKNVYWESSTGYLFSQAASSPREFGLYRINQGMSLWAGGTLTNLFDVATVFGSAIIDVGELDFTLEVNGDWLLSADSVVVASGTATRGGVRVDGTLFMFGARASTNNSGETQGAYLLTNNDKLGDVSVFVDDVLVRQYTMPATGTNVTESVSGSNGTLRNGNGTSDWEVLAGNPEIVAPSVSAFQAIDVSTGLSSRTLTGQYTDLSPTLIEYRVTQGASEIIAWTSVSSFDQGSYSLTTSLPRGEGYQIEVRTTVDAQTYTDVSTAFDVCIALGFSGSSSASRLFSDSSATTSGVVHISNSSGNTRYNNESTPGSSIVALANYLHAQGEPIIACYDYGSGGTRLLNEWAPGTGSAYSDFVNAVGDNLSCIVDMVGYNDANAANDIVTQANFENYWSSLRTDTADVPIIHLIAQRDGNGGEASSTNAAFLALWQASVAAIDNDPNTYAVHRMDSDISADLIHNTNAAQDVYAQRIAVVVDFLFGSGSYYAGPIISSVVSSSATSTLVNLNTDNTQYSSILPATGLQGFRVLDDGVERTIISTSVLSSSQIEIVHDAVSGTRSLDFAAYNSNVDGDLIFDNYPVTDGSPSFPLTPLFQSLLESPVLSLDVAQEQTDTGVISFQTSDVISIDFASEQSLANDSVFATSSNISIGVAEEQSASNDVIFSSSSSIAIGFSESQDSANAIIFTTGQSIALGFASEQNDLADIQLAQDTVISLDVVQEQHAANDIEFNSSTGIGLGVAQEQAVINQISAISSSIFNLGLCEEFSAANDVIFGTDVVIPINRVNEQNLANNIRLGDGVVNIAAVKNSSSTTSIHYSNRSSINSLAKIGL